MGIEPKGVTIRSLLNTVFGLSRTDECDWRANFRVMRDNVGLETAVDPQLPHATGSF
jgi:hypothetical protein